MFNIITITLLISSHIIGSLNAAVEVEGARSYEGYLFYLFTYYTKKLLLFFSYKVFEMKPKSNEELSVLQSLSQTMDFWNLPNTPNKSVNVLVQPSDINKLELLLSNYNISSNVLIENVQVSIEQERLNQIVTRSGNRQVSFDAYSRFSDINRYLDRLAKAYPELVKVSIVGKSYEQRDMKIIRISDKKSRMTKKTIFIDAGIHAREWIAPATALYIIHELVENYSINKNLLKTLDWVILPCANPDGYEFSHTQVSHQLYGSV